MREKYGLSAGMRLPELPVTVDNSMVNVALPTLACDPDAIGSG